MRLSTWDGPGGVFVGLKGPRHPTCKVHFPQVRPQGAIYVASKPIPLHAGIDAHLVAPVAWRVPPTKTAPKKVA